MWSVVSPFSTCLPYWKVLEKAQRKRKLDIIAAIMLAFLLASWYELGTIIPWKSHYSWRGWGVRVTKCQVTSRFTWNIRGLSDRAFHGVTHLLTKGRYFWYPLSRRAFSSSSPFVNDIAFVTWRPVLTFRMQ